MPCQDWHSSVAGVPGRPDHLQPLADRPLDNTVPSEFIVVASVIGAGTVHCLCELAEVRPLCSLFSFYAVEVVLAYS